MHTLPVSLLSVLLPLRDRIARLSPVYSPVFHLSSPLIPSQEQEEGWHPPSVNSPLAHILDRTDSDATRRDLSANDAPSPAIKTSVCTTLPHLISPSNSPRLKPAESWLGVPRC